MRFFTFSRFGLVVVAAVSFCWLQPQSIRAEDEQGTAVPEETDRQSEPARETPNFISGESQATAPSPKPAPSPVAGREESSERDEFGIGKFARFPFKLSISLLGGYDDNVITNTAQGNPSVYFNPSAQLTYRFGDARTDANLKAGAGFSYYLDRPGDQAYDVSFNLGLAVSHRVSSRFALGLVSYLTYQTEPDFSANVGTNRRSGNFFYSTDKFLASYQWLPRFSTATSYNLVVVKYDNSAIGQFQDRSEHTFENEFRFLVWPMTTLLADYRYQIVSYENTPASQSSADSKTQLLLAGVDHKFDPRLGVSLRGGAQFRSYDDGRDLTEPYFEGELNYAAGRRTTVTWTNRYSLEEPGVAGNQSRTTFRTGLQAKYGFTKRISSTVGFYFVHDDYAEGPPTELLPGFFLPGAPAFAEDSLDLSLGVRYEINHTLAVDVGYDHTEVTSDFVTREYSRNRYFGGLNLSF